MGISLGSEFWIICLFNQLIYHVHRDSVSLTNVSFRLVLPTPLHFSGFIVKNLYSVLILHAY